MLGWIGVDLDGTLARDDEDRPYHMLHIGPPVPAMVLRVKAWLQSGVTVKIMTARMSCTDEQRPAVRAAIQAWTVAHLGRSLSVTNVKDYGMLALYDDRAVQVERNTGRLIGGEAEP